MVSVTIHLPEGVLQIIKAIFDTLNVLAFVFVFVIIFYARTNLPIFKRKSIFYPLLGFAILGIISTTMDMLDEFFWFSPKSFYNSFWKPTRLVLIIIALFLLVMAFAEFYRFNKRLLGK